MTTATQLSPPEIRSRVAAALTDAGIAQEIRDRRGTITQNSQAVLQRRYLAKDPEGTVIEDTPGMFRRVAKNLSQADLRYGASEQERQVTEDLFYDVMTSLDLLPNSPTLMNAGRELQQLSACFVLPVLDDLRSIFDTVRDTALIHQSGGGTGFAFSRLRPEGSIVGTTGGVASGPVSFISTFDSATEVIKQGGTRRGANMAILNVTHPDILKFIRAKSNPDKLQNFNISVGATREFMRHVVHGGHYELVNPATGKVTGTLDAQAVFAEIIHNAWLTGDPGLVFLDHINDHNPNPSLGEIESTNPCFAGSVRLATDQGLLTFQELFDNQTQISVLTDDRVEAIRHTAPDGPAPVATATMSGVRLRQALPVYRTRTNHPVYRLETDMGFEIIATQDHRIFTPAGLTPLKELNPGDEILIQSSTGAWNQDDTLPYHVPSPTAMRHLMDRRASYPSQWTPELGRLLGWLTAETRNLAYYVQPLPPAQGRTALTFRGPHQRNLSNDIHGDLSSWTGLIPKATVSADELTLTYDAPATEYLASLGHHPDTHHRNLQVPDSVWAAPEPAVRAYLSALFTAAGSAPFNGDAGEPLIQLHATSRALLTDLQQMLLNFGILASIHESGTQDTLLMAGHQVRLFTDRIGFATPDVQSAAELLATPPAQDRPATDRVKSIAYHGTEDVYCTTEPETNSLIAGGIVASNCGEQMLLPYESCNLASINLGRMTIITAEGAVLDESKLKRTIETGVHLLDNVIDMNRYPLEEVEEKTLLTRRIGLGVMGLADLLIQLGLRYDSEEALEATKHIMGRIQELTHEASHQLALSRGPFPAWENSIYGPALAGDASRPMRNTAPTTVAPTGTISIIAGAASGVEPLFALAYERNVMDNTRLVESNPYLKAIADSEGFNTPEFMAHVARTGTLEGTEAPEWVKQLFRTSQEINPHWHVRMQAAVQDHVDNAVSKTINFPSDATEAHVRTAYLLAYDLGCKGITVYRDGSKENQVLSTGRTASRTEEAHRNGDAPHDASPLLPRPRPRRMMGVTERLRTGHGNMYITVNYDEKNAPFEVFGNLGKAGGCDSAQLEAITRLTTLALRSGIDPDEIFAQLNGITCCPFPDEGVFIKSSPDALALALYRATHDGENPHSHQTQSAEQTAVLAPRATGPRCPDCNNPVMFLEGCYTCATCGWEKCS